MDCDYIPEDLLTCILVRLPVKSLLRCKAVSKSWFSLISSPSFVKSHFEKKGVDETLLICRDSDQSMYLCHPDSLQCGPPLGLPGDLSFARSCQVVGSCYGVVCVSVVPDTRPRMIYNQQSYRDIYLWNPATKQSKLLPPHNRSNKNIIKSVTIGFGFDLIGNDFKVVRVVIFKDWFPSVEVEVYSANRNYWQNVEPKHLIDLRFQCYEEFDICSNGFLCCKGWCEIIAFDLREEVFNCAVKLPPESYKNGCITNFNDSIAFVRIIGDDRMSHKISLWTLDDDRCLRGGGIEASWTLLLSFHVGQEILFVIGYINSCDLILMGQDATGDLVWFSCNPERNEVRNFPDSLELFRVIKYKESLFPIG